MLDFEHGAIEIVCVPAAPLEKLRRDFPNFRVFLHHPKYFAPGIVARIGFFEVDDEIDIEDAARPFVTRALEIADDVLMETDR